MILTYREEIIVVNDKTVEILSISFSKGVGNLNITEYSNSDALDTEHSHTQPRRCSVRIGVLRNFAKFTGKCLCQSLFSNKVASLSLQLY